MANATVEVVVRFAGDLIEVTRVRAGERCRIGTFEFSAEEHGELACGHVTISMSRVGSARPVARRAVELRPIVYAACSLAAHLTLLIVAFRLAQPELPGVAIERKGRPMRLAKFTAPAQTVKRAATPPPIEIPITTDTTPSPSPATDTPSPAASQGARANTMLGESPAQEAAPAEERPGTTRAFDPTTSPEFDTIKTGAYATESTGRAAGEREGSEARRSSLVVVSCDSASCLVLGGENATPIRKAVEHRLADIIACYEAANIAGRKVEVDFGIDTTGKIEQVGGTGDLGTCVGNVVRSMELE